MYLLDTNIISETRRPARIDGNVGAWLARVDGNALFTSVITLMELERGILRMARKDPAQGQVLRQWFEGTVKAAFAGRVLPIDERTAAICAGLHVPDPCPDNDAWIAASAKQHGLILVTRNVADFKGLGVKIIDPFKGDAVAG